MDTTTTVLSTKLVTIPNALTIARLIAIPFFVSATLTGQFDLAFAVFLGAGITDVFDGYIARRLNQRSTLGAVLDPAADKIMLFAAYLLYTFHGGIEFMIPAWLTFTIFMRDLMITFYAYLMYTRAGITRFPPSTAGKLSTVCQITMVSVTIAANGYMNFIAEPLLPMVINAALVLTLLSGFGYLRRAPDLLDKALEETRAD